ncbi:hypothetical protein, partial [Paraburkholderia piptadeniae]
NLNETGNTNIAIMSHGPATYVNSEQQPLWAFDGGKWRKFMILQSDPRQAIGTLRMRRLTRK